VTIKSGKYTNILMGTVQAAIAHGALDAVRAGDTTGLMNLTGLELSNSRQLLTAASTGEVIMTNTSFSSLTSFSVGSQITTLDAFVTPPPVSSVQEPAGLTRMAIGLRFVAGSKEDFLLFVPFLLLAAKKTLCCLSPLCC
jgi:hypothetical protein